MISYVLTILYHSPYTTLYQMLLHVVLHYISRCITLHCIIMHFIMSDHIKSCSIPLCDKIKWHDIVLHHTVLYCILLCNMISYFFVSSRPSYPGSWDLSSEDPGWSGRQGSVSPKGQKCDPNGPWMILDASAWSHSGDFLNLHLQNNHGVSQWVDLRENLQETIDVPMTYGIFL